MTGPTQNFWQARFDTMDLPWDRGSANTQLLQWIADGTIAPGSRIIVPGCGQGWEVAALAAAGMTTTGIDFAPGALALCRHLLDTRKIDAHLVEANVLQWQPGVPADYVFEQTCLCALYPDHWIAYARQLHRWLKPGGRLLAMFMQAPRPDSAQGVIEGPPYHCDINAMRALFPEPQWAWPKPPYPQVLKTVGIGKLELAVVLQRT